MTPSKLRLITLDLTGTVFRFSRPVVSTYRAVGDKHGVHCEEADLKRSFRVALKKLNASDPHFGAVTHGSSEKWWRQIILETFKGALGPSFSEKAVRPVANELYSDYSNSQLYEVYPDAERFLKLVDKVKESRGIAVGALTNFDRRVVPLVRLLGLTALDFVACSEVAGSSKPEPGIFIKAMQDSKQASLKPNEIVHIGDDLENDYLGARALGWNALLLDRDGRGAFDVDAEHICKDLDEAAEKLRL